MYQSRRLLRSSLLAAATLLLPMLVRAQFVRGATLRLDSGYWTDAQPGFFEDLKLSEWSTTVGVQARLAYFFTDLIGVEVGATLQTLLNDIEGARGYNFGFVGLVMELPGYAKRVEE